MPSTGSLLMWVITSPAWMPARKAGVSSIGDTTLTRPSSIVTSMPETTELALGLDLHVAVFLGIEIAGMRVERGQHAVDRRLDQHLVGHLLDVFGADALEHVTEQLQLPEGIGGAGLRHADRGHRDRGHHDGHGEQAGHTFPHQPRTLLLLAASHGKGLIGRPFRLSSTCSSGTASASWP